MKSPKCSWGLAEPYQRKCSSGQRPKIKYQNLQQKVSALDLLSKIQLERENDGKTFPSAPVLMQGVPIAALGHFTGLDKCQQLF